MKIKEFDNVKDRIDWIISNKSTLIAQKKAELKQADSFSFATPLYDTKEDSFKANDTIKDYKSLESIKVQAIINTTKVIDSHQDMHVDGIWSKSLKENKAIMHLQEHRMAFDSIISDGKDLKAYAKMFNWSELGINKSGQTQALVFESTVKADRNPKMFEQYAKGYVKNHSVGMQYVKMLLAVNDEEYSEEFNNWNKYLPMAINPEAAKDEGFFWVVLEAKAIEGSAVPIGSNRITPTTENNMKSEPSDDTHKEPSNDTQLIDKLNILLTKV